MGTRSFDSHGQCECMTVPEYDCGLLLSMTVLDSHTLTLSMWVKRSVPKYSLLRENPAPTQQDIEDNFDGNLCRCTGYRAILDSMKTFGVDSSAQDGGVIDIEVCDGVHLFILYILSCFVFLPIVFLILDCWEYFMQDSFTHSAQGKQQRFQISRNVSPDNIFWTI